MAERMMETLAELPLTGDQEGLFKAQPGQTSLLLRDSPSAHQINSAPAIFLTPAFISE